MSKHLPPSKNKHVKQAQPALKTVAEAADAAERVKSVRKMPETAFSLRSALPVMAALAVYVLALALKAEGLKRLISFLLPALIAGAPVLFRTVLGALKKEFAEGDLLLLIAAAAAFCLGEYATAAAAVVLYRVVELLEAFLLSRREKSLRQLREALPKRAGVETPEGVSQVSPQELTVGETVVVMPGEAVPADGIVVEGMSSLDPTLLTGNGAPLTVAPGSRVLSGCVNLTNMLRVQVQRGAEESAAQRLIEMVEISNTNRSGREKFIARFTAVFPPVAAAAGLLIALLPPLFQGGGWLDWLRRAVAVWLLASPCGLLASVPETYFGGIASAARLGVFLKGTRFLETLAKARTMIFEKTGVITEKSYHILEAVPANGDAQVLLRTAALAESHSDHPIAQALRAASGMQEEESIQVDELPCRGVSAFTEGKHVYVGNAGLMAEHNISCAVPRRKGVAIHVAADNRYLGYLVLENKVRDGAFDALESMRRWGVKNLVMLTGDLHSVARQIASSLSFDMVKTELSPAGKMAAVEYLMAAKGDNATLVYVGSGRNDAELFERADAGVVLDALDTPQALDGADVIVMGEDIRTAAELMRIAKQSDLTARLSILVSFCARLGGIALAPFGLVPLWGAVALSAGAALFSGVNALRAQGGFRAGREDGSRL